MDEKKYSYNAQNLIISALDPLYRELKHGNIVNGTVEIIDAHLRFHGGFETALNLGSHRKPQIKYAENELKWYLSMDRCIKGHPGIEDNKIWSSICTDNGIVNSNYGWCVFSPENGNKRIFGKDGPSDVDLAREMSQYDFALRQLEEKPFGRQSIIYYSRPQMQWEWHDGTNAKSDFTCTINTQHFIRRGMLHYIVNMRSNDALFGLHAGDLPWHGYVFNKMLADLNKYQKDNHKEAIQPGDIFWNAGSLHIYERHFDLLTKIVEEYREWDREINGPKCCAPKDCMDN